MDPVAVEAFETKVLKQPEVFFTPSEEVANDIKSFTKHVFDHCTAFVSKASVTPLDQLYVEGFDADQIWEQLQLQNGPLVNELAKRIRVFNKQPEVICLFPVEKDDEEEEEDDDEEDEEDAEKGEDDEQEQEDDDDATVNSSDEDEKDALSGSDDDSDAEKKPAPKQQQKKKKATKPKKERDVAEDGFFDWDEMDKAAEEEEEDEEDDIDLNDDLDDDDDDDDDDDGDDNEDDDEDDEMEEGSDAEDAKDMKYEDFFDGPEGENDDDDEEEEDDDEEGDENDANDDDDDDDDLPRVDRAQFDEEAGDEDDMAERGILSSHQRQQLRLKKEITELEKEALGEKPWLLKGEVKSSARPENSLLEAILDYDRPGKVAPVITVEVSVALEDMIKKRILEDDFDDVIRKFAGNEQDEKKKLEDVSMEKSKEGLGEIYEKEYMKSAMGFEMDDESKQDQEEIDVMFKSLCWKLDALSNYQFTPKPMVKELQVKPSVPAIAMEEVVPISVSDANLKAPEEIYEKKRKRGEAVLQSKEEMSQEQRKALRNAKKQMRRKENKQKEADERLVAKLNPGLGNKYAKKKLMESISNAKNVTTGKVIEGSTKQFSNSKEFFTRLQEEVKGQIQKKTKTNDA